MKRDPITGRMLSEPADVRFWAKVDKSGGPDACWWWQGKMHTKTGYGVFSETRTQGTGAHVKAWELEHGARPETGLCVCHRCDNRLCVNPSHLFLGTRAENQADMAAKGRAQRGTARWNSKLKDGDVSCITQQWASGRSQRAIAKEYGVSPATICNLLKGRVWRHVERSAP